MASTRKPHSNHLKMSTALAAARAQTKGKRLLREAMEAYGEDAFTLADWSEKMKTAELDGTWTWKQRVANANAAVKARFDHEGVQSAVKAKFQDLQAVMEDELRATVHAKFNAGNKIEVAATADTNECTWRERVGGKYYHCTNALPPVRRKKQPAAGENGEAAAVAATGPRLCLWHARECVSRDHPMERSKNIEIPNEQGLCLHCYEVAAGAMARVVAIKVPGVHLLDLKRDLQKDDLLDRKHKKLTTAAGGARVSKATATTICSWSKEHFQDAYVWRCTNRVLAHPTLHGSYLSFCGFHAPRCIQTYGKKDSKKDTCEPIESLNPFGMCRNHLEARLSTLPFDHRGAVAIVSSEFDVPGLVEGKKDQYAATVQRHPLAPKEPPPPTADQLDELPLVFFSIDLDRPIPLAKATPSLSTSIVTAVSEIATDIGRAILNHPNPLSRMLKEVLWRVRFARRAAVVATRIQRIYRGNRDRRRVHMVRLEHAARRRIRACRVVQRLVRGFLGRREYVREMGRVRLAVPTIQRAFRGGLARKHFRELLAIVRIQRNYRGYRQRMHAWALREELEYQRDLQRQADANYQEMLTLLAAFKRLRARRVLRAAMLRWQFNRNERKRLEAFKLQAFLAAVKLQRGYRRHRHYKWLKRRYDGAVQIQKRVRGWLTRHFWKEDPGVLFITAHVNPRTGFEYGKILLLGSQAKSYSYPTRRIRMHYGALTIQRAYRGHRGRLIANAVWVAMVKRWEWLSLDAADESSDALTLGHKRYGFHLPSYMYHRQRTMHMMSTSHDIKADRGFSYKYQSVLDLIRDRDGLRGWSVVMEERKQRERERQAAIRERLANKLAREKQRAAELAYAAMHAHEHAHDHVNTPISFAKALYPVGTLVNVSVMTVGKELRGMRRVWHPATIIAVRDAEKDGNATTFDVDFAPGLLSPQGVHVFQEDGVPVARIKAITEYDKTKPATEDVSKRKPLGKAIQDALDQLQADIVAHHDDPLPTDLPSVYPERSGVALGSVDAIADRLRDERRDWDLLHDERDFVNFVFQNSELLAKRWLNVVTHIRNGTREVELPLSSRPTTSTTASTRPRTPAMTGFYQEFGLAPIKPQTVAMPKRAAEIEQRMVKLGFSRDVVVALDEAEKRRPKPGKRPETVAQAIAVAAASQNQEFDPRPLSTRDDTAVEEAARRVHSAQDLHRLLYELKTLPRERQREKIISVDSRHSRSFVCGHPACGRCFSSHEAARMHQQSSHGHQERLATATPMVDQYLHAYWPPQSPWNDDAYERYKGLVGYFKCTQPGCTHVEFRSRRLLNDHLANEHSIHQRYKHDPLAGPLGQRLGQSNATRVIWLGSYTLCRNLHSKLGLKNAFADLAPCTVHPKTAHPSCRICRCQAKRPALPCRLYGAVALPYIKVHRRKTSTTAPDSSGETTASTEDSREEDEEEDDDDLADAFTIFSVEDSEFCPVLYESEVLLAGDEDKEETEDEKRARERRRRMHEPEPLTCIRLEGLCRDVNGEEWIIGYALQSRPKTTEPSNELVDAYELYLNDDRVAFAKLADVQGAAMVHHCSKGLFYRKHFRRDAKPAALGTRGGSHSPTKGSYTYRGLDPLSTTPTFGLSKRTSTLDLEQEDPDRTWYRQLDKASDW
ncbi:TPA: hypothetical protein N0F65_005881 [Lagenidium giganteum]|uniref:C2H2-type domain-containing protein n=1 Tax=Lagenidium giganteum TaxID=4803 RepID=A0AAV2YN92_9STRA|nr:TPA: hypothetical protein N0F65_005881 [Lagenidium giganteum]